jgi:hypothetical protein
MFHLITFFICDVKWLLLSSLNCVVTLQPSSYLGEAMALTSDRITGFLGGFETWHWTFVVLQYLEAKRRYLKFDLLVSWPISPSRVQPPCALTETRSA